MLELEPWNKDAKKELEKLGKEAASSPKEEKTVRKEAAESQFVQKLNERNKKSGKKIEIVEVDSSKSQPESSVSRDSNVVTPIVKMPHQRSQVGYEGRREREKCTPFSVKLSFFHLCSVICNFLSELFKSNKNEVLYQADSVLYRYFLIHTFHGCLEMLFYLIINFFSLCNSYYVKYILVY